MNWLFNSYYLVNDWFELKKHSLYVRLEFCPTNFVVGVSIVSERLCEIELLFFRVVIHWLKRNKDYMEDKKCS